MRGDIYRFKPGRSRQSHEQRGRRFAVVVQARRFAHLSTWLIVPTSASAAGTVYRPQIEIPDAGTSLALCEATVSIDPHVRLGDCVGSLGCEEMREIDAAQRLLMDLDLFA
jgi:mRNA interferase MazF